MTHGPPAKKRKSPTEDEDDSSDAMPIPPDGGWGWMVAFASFAIHIVSKYKVGVAFTVKCVNEF